MTAYYFEYLESHMNFFENHHKDADNLLTSLGFVVVRSPSFEDSVDGAAGKTSKLPGESMHGLSALHGAFRGHSKTSMFKTVSSNCCWCIP